MSGGHSSQTAPAATPRGWREDASSRLRALLRDKGDYLYRTEQGWSLSTAAGVRPVRVLTLKPSDGAWALPADSGTTCVIVFALARADLTGAVGRRIADYLTACRRQGFDVVVARPLPPEILPAGFTPSDLGIPTGCDQCLDLFRLDTGGDTLLCDGSHLEDFRFTRSGRAQVHSYLQLQNGAAPARLADGNPSALPLLRGFACTERPAAGAPGYRHFDFTAYWVSKVGWEESKLLRDFVDAHGARLVDGPVLDDGGGHGKDSFFLKARGFSPVLVDLNAKLLHHARRRRDDVGLDFPIVHCDGCRLPLPDAAFSGVYSGGVMHHALTRDGMQRYIDEASRVLRPGGLFFGNVWAHWDGKVPDNVLLLGSLDIFEAMLAGAGLRPIEPIETRRTRFEAHKRMWVFACEKAG